MKIFSKSMRSVIVTCILNVKTSDACIKSRPGFKPGNVKRTVANNTIHVDFVCPN